MLQQRNQKSQRLEYPLDILNRMHQHRPLLLSGLLLLAWLLLLTVPEALTNTRPAGRVAYHRLRLPPDKVDIELLQVDGTCVCRQACFATNCRCYTLVQVEAGGLDCLISRNDVEMRELQADVNVTTVCYTDYRPFDYFFYRIVKGVSIEEGKQQCNVDNAVLPRIHNEQLIMELINAMRQAGVKAVYGRNKDDRHRMLTLTVTEEGPSLVEQLPNPWPVGLPVACRRHY